MRPRGFPITRRSRSEGSPRAHRNGIFAGGAGEAGLGAAGQRLITPRGAEKLGLPWRHHFCAVPQYVPVAFDLICLLRITKTYDRPQFSIFSPRKQVFIAD